MAPPRGSQFTHHDLQNNNDGNTDGMISYLPEDVMRKILVHLPLKQAARTSILSTKWRHLWKSIPQLIFDDKFKRELKESQLVSQDKLMAFISKVIQLHQAPILKLELSFPVLRSCRRIDNTIKFLSCNGVEDLTLRITAGGKKHTLPSHFFAYQRLKYLSLGNCEIRCPVSFIGFNNLIEVELCNVTFTGSMTIQSFISSCPLLEDIQIVDDRDNALESLELLAPNLRKLQVTSSQLKSISLENAPKLAELHMFANKLRWTWDWEEAIAWKSSNVEKFFQCLAPIEHLELDSFHVECLTAGNVLMGPQTTLTHLKCLSLHEIWFKETSEISLALWLITSSPNLRSLTIKLYASKRGNDGHTFDFLKMQDYSNVSLDQLHEVRLGGLSCLPSESEFIRFLLDNSPKLKNFLISPSWSIGIEEEFEFIRKILALPRASTMAVIKYEKGMA